MRRAVVIVFEGRDTAGKGGVIKRITERVSPRVFRIVALPAPTARERSQMYIQRYISHLPAAGEVVIFDRSRYNRAGVEPVMGYCTPDESEQFLELVPSVDKKRGRLNIITHLLSQLPYEPLPTRDVTLAPRQPRGDYVEPDRPLRMIATPF